MDKIELLKEVERLTLENEQLKKDMTENYSDINPKIQSLQEKVLKNFIKKMPCRKKRKLHKCTCHYLVNCSRCNRIVLNILMDIEKNKKEE